jgi:hypothetical protein
VAGRRAAAAALAIAAVVLSVLHFSNAGKPPALDEPLKLRLDSQLSSYKA